MLGGDLAQQNEETHLVDVGFDHDAKDGVVAGSDLLAHAVANNKLVLVFLGRVAVREIDHDLDESLALFELCSTSGDGFLVVVLRANSVSAHKL